MNELAAQIIAFAGDAQSYAMEAISCARNLDFEQAEENLKHAQESALIAHRKHTELIALGARDENLHINLLVVHASNHLSVAETLNNMAELFIELKGNLNKK